MTDLGMAIVNNEPTAGDIPSSVTEWHVWLLNEEARTFRVYNLNR
jgi:hypothetical protein